MNFLYFRFFTGIVLACGLTLPGQTSREQQPKAAAGSESGFYNRWINEDVPWIITDAELAAWKKLTSNAQRDDFIASFWSRRDPTPDTQENEYKEEHYRRIAYVNQHYYAAGIPGWRTDRGRMYIMYGKPDSVDSYPQGGPVKEAGKDIDTYPFEVWRYRYLEGIGQEVEIEFVDRCKCGEYQMALDRSEKDALLRAPNAFFDSKFAFTKPTATPAVKFKDLEAVVNTKVRYNLLPFDLRVDFMRITRDTVLVPITIQVPNRELTFVNKDGVQRAELNIFGRITTLTGNIVTTFEAPLRLDVPPELMARVATNVALYWKALPLSPGHYRLDVVLKDVNGDKLGNMGQTLAVPEYVDGVLASSTLVLADVIEPVPSREAGTGEFVLGTTKVRPRVSPSDGKPATFTRGKDSKVSFWMQVYNLALDEKTRKPSALIQYQVVNTATKSAVVDLTENTEAMTNVGDQLTLQKSLPLAKMEPGVYHLTIHVNDQIAKQTISSTARFAVE